MRCGQYADANRLFEILKDTYSPLIYTEADYRKARDEARQKGGAKK